MKILANRLDRGFHLHQKEYEEAALRVLRSAWYILGEEVENFETEFADYIGAKYCVGLDNATNALIASVKLLDIGVGDEVIVQANSYIAGVMGITENGAFPVFVDCDEFYNIDVTKIETAITKKTRAIMVVHLYGQSSDMASIMQIAKKHNLHVIEDCAQSHGAKHGETTTGTFGDIGVFSFYPTKNLGAFGDAGAIVTNDAALFEKFKQHRNYGFKERYYSEFIGANSRLDEMQAALLRVRLAHMSEITNERIDICVRYLKEIKNDKIKLPIVRQNCNSVWHQFVVRVGDRPKFINHLTSHEVGHAIHYPQPPHLAKAYEYLGNKSGDFEYAERYANTVVSLPLYSGMTKQEISRVIEAVNSF